MQQTSVLSNYIIKNYYILSVNRSAFNTNWNLMLLWLNGGEYNLLKLGQCGKLFIYFNTNDSKS